MYKQLNRCSLLHITIPFSKLFSRTLGFFICDQMLWCNFRGIGNLLIKPISGSLAGGCPTYTHTGKVVFFQEFFLSARTFSHSYSHTAWTCLCTQNTPFKCTSMQFETRTSSVMVTVITHKTSTRLSGKQVQYEVAAWATEWRMLIFFFFFQPISLTQH